MKLVVVFTPKYGAGHIATHNPVVLSANKLLMQSGPHSFVFGIAKYIGSVVQRDTQRLFIGSATSKPTHARD